MFRWRQWRRRWHELRHGSVVVEHAGPGVWQYRCACGRVLGETRLPMNLVVDARLRRDRARIAAARKEAPCLRSTGEGTSP
jgi:hypothetical protein